MDTLDREMAQRVWQRVQGEHREDPVPALCRRLQECSADARQLAREHRNPELLALSAQLQQQAACLRGIQALRSGTQQPLRSLIGKQLQLYGLLQTAAADPEYGPILAELAEQTRKTAQQLLTMAGR